MSEIFQRIHEVRRAGNLYFLLNAFIGAYNRRTDALSGGLQAIALALSTPQDNSTQVQAEIDRLTAELKASRESVEAAIKQDEGDT